MDRTAMSYASDASEFGSVKCAQDAFRTQFVLSIGMCFLIRDDHGTISLISLLAKQQLLGELPQL